MAKKSTKSTKSEVSVKGQFTQENVPAMLEQVNKKIATLKGGAGKEPSTSGKNLPGFGEIAKITNEAELIKAYSSVTGRAKAYADAATAMKIKTKVPAFVLDGIAPAKWLEDITLRYQEVAFAQQITTLEKIKKTLEENLSAESKLANDLKKINDLMSDI